MKTQSIIFFMKLEDVLNTGIEDEDELSEKLQTVPPQHLPIVCELLYQKSQKKIMKKPN